MSERPYVKVYREIIDDPRFATIYPDDRNLATWLRMLQLADAMYPAPAPLAGFNRRSVAALADPECGLIELVGVNRYRLHGLKTERMLQSDAGRAGAAARWGGMAPASDLTWGAMPTSRAEPRPDQPSPSDGPTAYYEVTLSYPAKPTLIAWCDELVGKYGLEKFRHALSEEYAIEHTTRTLMSRTQARLMIANAETVTSADQSSFDKRVARTKAKLANVYKETE